MLTPRSARIAAGVLALLAAATALSPGLPGGATVVLLLDASRSAGGTPATAREHLDRVRNSPEAGDAPPGIVLFARDAVLLRRPGDGLPLGPGELDDAVARSGDGATDPSRGLEAALDLIPSGGSGRILVSTDGRFPPGARLEAALDRARAAGVVVRTLDPDLVPSPVPRAAALDAPPRVRPGARIPLTVLVAGAAGAEGILRLEDEGAGTAEERSFRVPHGGGLSMTFAARPGRPGRRTFRARVVGGPARAVATTAVLVEEGRAVLRVGEEPMGEAMAGLLAAATGSAPGDLHGPGAASELAGRPLDGTPAIVVDGAMSRVDAAVEARLLEAVRGGAGLVVFGGSGALGAGPSWAGLEDGLPVSFHGSGPGPRFVLAVDTSGSMEERGDGSASWAELCAAATARLAATLPGDGSLALLRFAETATRPAVFDLSTEAGRSAAVEEAGRVPVSGGGTRFAAAVEGAVLAATGAGGPRILLLVTDGRPADGVEEARAAGLRLERSGFRTLVCVLRGTAGSSPSLDAFIAASGALMADPGDGDAGSLARRLLEAARSVTAVPWRARETVVVAGPDAGPWGAAPSGLPPVAGCNSVHLREGGRAWLVADDGTPLLAAGQYGLGRVVVFASHPRLGGGAWLREPARSLLEEALRWSLRTPGEDGLVAEAVAGEDGSVEVDVRGTLPAASGSPVLAAGTALRRVGPSRWRGTLATAPPDGIVAVVQDGSVVARAPVRAAACVEDLPGPRGRGPALEVLAGGGATGTRPGGAAVALVLLAAAALLHGAWKERGAGSRTTAVEGDSGGGRGGRR